jgi:hypothetical protein
MDARLERWTQVAQATESQFGEADKRSLAFGLTCAYLTLCDDRTDVKQVFEDLEHRFPFTRYQRRTFQYD